MKRKLVTIFLILIILLSITSIKVPANAFEDSQGICITQGEIKNKQYLLIDNYIARISPETEVESFVMQMGLENKEIIIYKDANKDIEVKEGLIASGMVITVRDLAQEKQKDYELSVWGDINQDGYVNISEVVNIINYIVGTEGEEITKTQFLSSDLNGDGKVNIVDLNKLIRYIVYEELEIGEVEEVKEPSIDIKGTKTNGWYREDTKAIIKTNEENFKKTVYSVNGNILETTNKEEEILITEEGTSKIITYTINKNDRESKIVQKEVKIDKQVPVIEKIKKSQEEGIVGIRIIAKDELSGLDEEAYSFDGGLSWQKENYKEYNKNQEQVDIRIRDNAGNIKSEIITIQDITDIEKSEFEVTFKNYNGDILQSTLLEKGSIPSYTGKTPKKAIAGYKSKFAGWDKPIRLVTEDVEYVATFTDKIIEYSISYELNGGILDKENPTSYNIETETFVLENPQKADYTFVGWSLNEDEKPIEEVIIEKGSIGNRKYTANWEETVYVARNQETNKEYASINLALKDAEEGQTIILLENTKREVVVPEGKKVTLDLNGKTITTSDEEKATLINNGELTIIDNGSKEGRIKNSKGKAIVNEATAILNVGVLNDEIKTVPYIEGKTVGIEDNGVLNYYDGAIIGNKAIIGNVDSIPEGYNLLIGQTTNETKEQTKIGLLEEAEAKRDEVYYLTLSAAMKAANYDNKENPKQETIVVLKDIEIKSQINVKSNANIKLDLNNKQITNNSNINAVINNIGKLEITDLSEEKGGMISTTASTSLINNEAKGQITISGGKLSYATTKLSNYYYSTAINNQGKLDIEDGEIYTNSASVYLINNNGELNVYGGTIKIENTYYYSSVCINNNNKLIVKAGKIINTNSSGIVLKNYGNLTIEQEENQSTELDMQGYTLIDNENSGTVLLRNMRLNLSGSDSIINNGNSIGIIKSEIYSEKIGIKNNRGNLEIKESTIITKEECIYNEYGTVIIEDSTLESTDTYYNTMYNLEGSFIIKSGNILSKKYGIYNQRGTITIGINDGKVYPTKYPNKNSDEKYPIIKGEKYAIYNYNGTFNYYDGILFGTKGLDQIIYGVINSIADVLDENNESKGKYNILYNSLETSMQYYTILGLEPICKILDEKNKPIRDEDKEEILYYNLKDAFDNCKNGYTIQIIIDINYEDMIEIAEEKNVKLDLNGYKITCANSEGFIINNGTLEIFDSEETENSAITSVLSKCIIENNGILRINEVTISNNKGGTSENYNEVIRNNSGELIIDGGNITSTSSYVYTINNKAETKIIKGKIGGYNLTNYGILTVGGFTEEYNAIQISGVVFNNESGEIVVNEGTIETITNRDNGNVIVKDEKNNTYITTINNEGQGNIIITDGKIVTINNKGEGLVDFIEGTVTSGIYNLNSGTIEVKGGILKLVSNQKEGIVRITEGIISGAQYAIENYGTGLIEVKGGNIIGTTYGVYNMGRGIINITGGNITGGTHGIYSSNYDDVVINVISGTITGKQTGIYIVKGILNLGTNDKQLYPELDMKSQDKYPTIIGAEYGIYNEGIFNYYDGIIYIDEKSENAIYGSIDDKANIYNDDNEIIGKYDVIFKDIEEEHYAILSQMPICKLLNSNNEVVTDENGNEILYYNFEDAIKDSLEDYTIQIERSINYKDKIEVPEGKKIKLDLNGNRITSSNKECLIRNNGNLGILDASDSSTGEIISINCEKIIENNGTMTIKSGTIYNQNNGTQANYICTIENKSGTLIIEGGYLVADEKDYYINIIENYDNLIIRGGTISGYNTIQNYGITTINSGQIDEDLGVGEVGNITNKNNGIVTLNDGNVKYKEDIKIYNMDKGKMSINHANINGIVYNYSDDELINCEMTIDGGNIENINNVGTGKIKIQECRVSFKIENYKSGTIEMIGGEINSTTTSVYNDGEGIINIEGTNIETESKGIYNESIGEINLKGVNINSSNYGVYNYGTGTINIEKSNIESQTTGVYNVKTGEINIVESKISSKGTGSSYYNYYGIYNNNGTINVGENNSEAPKNTTEIKSMYQYAIYNNTGKINFYDGTIIGKTRAVYGKVEKAPEGYAIKSEIKTIELIEDIEVYTLEKVEHLLLESDANIGIIYYNNLQDAINACTNSEDVISLQRDVSITEILTIKEGQTITIDLNGFAIEGSIENNGTLNITNTKGTIEEGSYGTITGSGTTSIQ